MNNHTFSQQNNPMMLVMREPEPTDLIMESSTDEGKMASKKHFTYYTTLYVSPLMGMYSYYFLTLRYEQRDHTRVGTKTYDGEQHK